MLIQEVLGLNEAVQAKKSDFEKVIAQFAKDGKDFVTVNMIQIALNNLTKQTVDGKSVTDLCQATLEPAAGKKGYFDVASYQG